MWLGCLGNRPRVELQFRCLVARSILLNDGEDAACALLQVPEHDAPEGVTRNWKESYRRDMGKIYLLKWSANPSTSWISSSFKKIDCSWFTAYTYTKAWTCILHKSYIKIYLNIYDYPCLYTSNHSQLTVALHRLLVHIWSRSPTLTNNAPGIGIAGIHFPSRSRTCAHISKYMWYFSYR